MKAIYINGERKETYEATEMISSRLTNEQCKKICEIDMGCWYTSKISPSARRDLAADIVLAHILDHGWVQINDFNGDTDENWTNGESLGLKIELREVSE